MSEYVPVERDENSELPVPTEWRETILSIVARFADEDYELRCGVKGVLPVPSSDAAQIEKSIKSYGDKLAPLSPETWNTSIYQATAGGWEVLIDLYTVNEGASDLVLFIFVQETNTDYRFEVQSVHVP